MDTGKSFEDRQAEKEASENRVGEESEDENSNPEQLNKVKTLIAKQEGKYRRSAWGWKVSYRFFLVVSAFLSGSAAIVGKLDYFDSSVKISGLTGGDITAILAGMAAVVTTLIAALDFEVNWRTNRKSRHNVAMIKLEAEKLSAKPDELIEKLKEVIKQRSDDLENNQD